MEKILKNERTNEQTNERANERLDQEFMNEILSTTREIKENPLFRHENQLFRQLLENIGNCYQQIMRKKQRIITIKSNENQQEIFGNN